MPAYNRLYSSHLFIFSPTALKDNGAVLTVEISISNVLENLLKSQNLPIPQPITGIALIDTGATNSCVDQKIISTLGVQPVGTINSGTAGGIIQQNLYPAHFRFPQENLDLNFTACAGVTLDGQNALGKPIVALLGRDILARFILIYNGPAGMFTITT